MGVEISEAKGTVEHVGRALGVKEGFPEEEIVESSLER